MQALKIGTTATAAGVTPFCEGWEVVACVYGAGVIQGSQDGVTYTTLVTGTASDITMQTIRMPAFIQTTTGDAYILGGA